MRPVVRTLVTKLANTFLPDTFLPSGKSTVCFNAKARASVNALFLGGRPFGLLVLPFGNPAI